MVLSNIVIKIYIVAHKNIAILAIKKMGIID